MKNTVLFLLASFLLSRCNDDQLALQDTGFYGTWQEFESYSALNPGDGWYRIPNEIRKSVEIFPNGTFKSTRFRECNNDEKTYIGNIQHDDIEIIFEYRCDKSTEGIELSPGMFSYSYTLEDYKTLVLVPNYIFCDEGCGSRYIKVADPDLEE
ncbi:MAG: hypothetical protein OXH57_01285 [Ekhidna sp.]|nr:hypothetical protein [Ekhidna sp.]